MTLAELAQLSTCQTIAKMISIKHVTHMGLNAS